MPIVSTFMIIGGKNLGVSQVNLELCVSHNCLSIWNRCLVF